MSRLVLRLSLGMIVVLAATAGIVRWAARSTAERHFGRTVPSLIGSIDRARRILERTPPERRDRALAELRRTTSVPLELRALAEVELSPRERGRLAADGLHVARAPHQGISAYLPLGDGQRVLVIGPLGRFAHRHDFPVGLVLAAIIAVVGLTGFLLAAPLVRRLRQLERVAVRISEGELEARAPDASADAIGSLARRFNIMADRVQTLLESQRQLIQAVAHELRTPMARVRFGLEALSTTEGGEGRAARVQAIDEDLMELDRLVEELLLYIRAGDRALELEPAPLAAREEIAAVAERLRELRPEVVLELLPGGEAETLRADARYFRRAVQNLLSNALRHARERVTVGLARDAGELSIAVSDDGPGVPVAERERIFEPFTRLDQSRSRESGGVGLGLAIVRRIVEAHGGRVTVDQAAAGGARFTTVWPLGDTDGYRARPKQS